jgi:polyhydroxyalkanoate synthase
VERLTAAFGNMPGALINQGFVWQKPLDTLQKPWRTWEKLDDPSFARFFAVMESWNNDQVDVPGAAYRRLIEALYRDNALAEGRFVLGGEKIDLRRIACPLLVVTAQHDTTCPPAAATALQGLVSTPADRQRHLTVKGGHVATVAGPKARATLHTPIAEWLRA